MPTIYTIAQKAGVSPKTAARILSGETKNSKGREAVLMWAEKLGYVRNANAANLRTGRTQIVGLIVPSIENPYYTRIIQEFHDALAAEGFQTMVTCSFGKTEGIVSALKGYSSHSVDGVFFNGSEGKITPEIAKLLSQFQESGKPVVLIGRETGGLKADQAMVSDQKGIEEMVQYLAAKGRKNFAFVGGNATNLAMKHRCAGFRESLQGLGLPVREDWLSFGKPTAADAFDRVKSLLQSAQPDAIVCANDLLATAVIKACRSQKLIVPEDIAVTGFDDIDLATLCEPELTTIRQPIDEIARACVKVFLDRLHHRDPDPAPKRLHFPAKLIPRASG